MPSLAAIPRCSNSCHTAYKRLAQHAHNRQLWQTARLTLQMPPMRWVRRVVGAVWVQPGTPLSQLYELRDYILKLLLETLHQTRQSLQQDLQQRSRYLAPLSDWIQTLVNRRGPLLVKDQHLLKQLLRDSQHPVAQPAVATFLAATHVCLVYVSGTHPDQNVIYCCLLRALTV